MVGAAVRVPWVVLSGVHDVEVGRTDVSDLDSGDVGD